jgi:THO complex subunit 5
MEYWINSIDDEQKLAKKNLLAKQLKRTMSCLDIYLETEGTYYSPAEFTADKTFIRAFRGRQRSRPFKIIPNGSGVVYTQL